MKANRVLVVDDERLIRELVSNYLEMEGFEFFTAKNGSDALELFKEHEEEIFLVLFDVQMPVMGGDELLAHIREAGSEVKAIAITGFAPEATLAKIRELGVIDILVKPFDIKILLDLLERSA